MELKKCKLSDVAKVEISSVDKKSKESESPVRLCNFTDVYHNWAITKEMKSSFMEATANDSEIKKFTIKKGQVAFTKDSETRDDIGIPTYIADDFDNVVLGYHCALVTPDENKLSGKYLNAFMHSAYIHKYFENSASGSGQRYTLSLETLESMPLLLPSMDEQKRIGEIFSTIDKKIVLNHSINQNLEAIPKLLYDRWFVQFDFPNEEGKPYKNSAGGMTWSNVFNRDIPIGWETKKMQDISLIRRGASPRPIDNFMDDTHKGMPWLKISDATINDSPFVVSIKEHIIIEGVSKSVEIEEGTLVVTNSATPGLPKFIQERCCVHDGWLVLTEYKDEMKYYLYYVLDNMRKALERMASGSIFKNLRTDYLQNYFVLVPPKELLRRYSEIVEPIMQEALQLSFESESLIKQRDELLPLLMNGQVSLNSDLSHDL